VDPAERTLRELTSDLRRLGLERGQLVMVHASLGAVGPVAGGFAMTLAARLAADVTDVAQ
jgi:aminoglycoside 3-N-acetyltransferase/aminoglycoside 3-N-acetyltransferase-2